MSATSIGPAGAAPGPTPFLQVVDVLGADEHRALLLALDAQAERLPTAPPARSAADDRDRGMPVVDLGPSWSCLDARLRALVGHVRRELAVEHFVLEGIDARVTAYDDASVRVGECAEPAAGGTSRIGFVYVVQPSGAGFTGGALRLFDTVEVGGTAAAGETFTEVEALDNAIVFFPSDRHHEVTRLLPVGVGPSARYVISGSFRGDPRPPRPPAVDADVLRVLQQRYLPTVSEAGFEVRATPAAVHSLLESLLVLRSGDRRSEDADAYFHTSGSPDLVDVQDFGADLLRWLQPVHEEFAGVPLVASNVFGLRLYRPGNTLEMHVDRLATHVVSSVLQVAQDVDEPWPLVFERGGRLHEVFLAPGQMVLYEGATSVHGRPTPLHGRSFVNLFVHYRPVDWPWTADMLRMRAWRDGVIDGGGRLTGRDPAPPS